MELELLLILIGAIIFGWANANILKLLFYSLSYGNRFWAFKFEKAIKHLRKYDKLNSPETPGAGERAFVFSYAESQNKDPNSQKKVMKAAYGEVAKLDYKFNLWDCSLCFVGFFGLISTLVISSLILVISIYNTDDYWELTYKILSFGFILYGSTVGFRFWGEPKVVINE